MSHQGLSSSFADSWAWRRIRACVATSLPSTDPEVIRRGFEAAKGDKLATSSLDAFLHDPKTRKLMVYSPDGTTVRLSNHACRHPQNAGWRKFFYFSKVQNAGVLTDELFSSQVLSGELLTEAPVPSVLQVLDGVFRAKMKAKRAQKQGEVSLFGLGARERREEKNNTFSSSETPPISTSDTKGVHFRKPSPTSPTSLSSTSPSTGGGAGAGGDGGDLTASPSLAAVPFRSRLHARRAWPAAASEDFLQNYFKFHSGVEGLLGRGGDIVALPRIPSDVLLVGEREGELSSDSVKLVQSRVLIWVSILRSSLPNLSDTLPHSASINCTIHQEDAHPSVEFSFWKRTRESLSFLLSQLDENSVDLVCSLLEPHALDIVEQLLSLRSSVSEAVSLSDENNKALSVLEREVTKLSYSSLSDLSSIRSLSHRALVAICVVCSKAQYYRRPTRIVMLLRQLCNLMIHISTTHIGDISSSSPSDEALYTRIKEVESVCTTFTSIYNSVSSKLCSLSGAPSLSDVIVLKRLKRFHERVRKLTQVLDQYVWFGYLDTVSVCGPKGSQLTSLFHHIHSQFLSHFNSVGFHRMNFLGEFYFSLSLSLSLSLSPSLSLSFSLDLLVSVSPSLSLSLSPFLSLYFLFHSLSHLQTA